MTDRIVRSIVVDLDDLCALLDAAQYGYPGLDDDDDIAALRRINKAIDRATTPPHGAEAKYFEEDPS